jgi:hypothetical protein
MAPIPVTTTRLLIVNLHFLAVATPIVSWMMLLTPSLSLVVPTDRRYTSGRDVDGVISDDGRPTKG